MKEREDPGKGKKSGWRTLGKVFLGTVAAALLLPPLLLTLMINWQPLKYTEKLTSGGYTVTVKHSDGQWPFGPAKAKVIAEGDGLGRKIYSTQIADDGGQGMVEMQWLDEDTARVILQGSEQRDEVITVDFGEELSITAVQ